MWYNVIVKQNPQEHYTAYQLKLPVEIEKIIEIPDPVYTFKEVFHHIDLNKYLDGTKITANANKYSRVWKKSSIKHRP